MPPTPLCTCRDAMEAHFIQAALEAEGIPARVIGESLEQLAGSLPVYHARTEIWINPADADRATRLLATLRGRGRFAAADDDAAWTCPHCGESIEPQFTECWKCQTPRPAAGDAPPSPAAPGDAEPMIATDLPCLRCKYNLRGLPASHACPECGLPLLQTLLAAQSAATQTDPRPLQAALRHLAANRGYPTPAILFLLEAYTQMLDLAAPVLSPRLEEINVPFFCHALARHAADHFGTPARALEQFTRWNLHTTADLACALSILWAATPDQAVAHFHPPVPLRDILVTTGE